MTAIPKTTKAQELNAPSIVSSKLVVILGLVAIFSNDWRHRTWPWGMASPWTGKPKYGLIDHDNDSLQTKRKIMRLCSAVAKISR